MEGVFYRLMFWSDIQRYFVPPSIRCKEHSTIGRMTLPGHIDASWSSLVGINIIFRSTIFEIVPTRRRWSGCLLASSCGVTVRVAAKLDIFFIHWKKHLIPKVRTFYIKHSYFIRHDLILTQSGQYNWVKILHKYLILSNLDDIWALGSTWLNEFVQIRCI